MTTGEMMPDEELFELEQSRLIDQIVNTINDSNQVVAFFALMAVVRTIVLSDKNIEIKAFSAEMMRRLSSEMFADVAIHKAINS